MLRVINITHFPGIVRSDRVVDQHANVNPLKELPTKSIMAVQYRRDRDRIRRRPFPHQRYSLMSLSEMETVWEEIGLLLEEHQVRRYILFIEKLWFTCCLINVLSIYERSLTVD